jgi:hypothetical protein
MKSLINSVLANLPKTLEFINDMIKEESKKHGDDFTFNLCSVNKELYIVPAVINDKNEFIQKEFTINDKSYKTVKLEDFIKTLIEEKLK